MPKPLQSDHQRYHVQCCIADPSAHLDTRCRLGMTGRAEINRIFAQHAVWFTPDDDSKNKTTFPVPLTALLFSVEAIEAMPEFCRRVFDQVPPTKTTMCNVRKKADTHHFHVCKKPHGHKGKHQCQYDSCDGTDRRCRHEWEKPNSLLTPVEVGFEIVPKNRKTKKLKRTWRVRA